MSARIGFAVDMPAVTCANGRAAVCPRCGGPFACGVDADPSRPCFCSAFVLGAGRLAELRARWSDCLCATCLASLAADPGRAA